MNDLCWAHLRSPVGLLDCKEGNVVFKVPPDPGATALGSDTMLIFIHSSSYCPHKGRGSRLAVLTRSLTVGLLPRWFTINSAAALSSSQTRRWRRRWLVFRSDRGR